MMTITSRKNPVIGEYRRLGADRDYRRETRSCLGQGRKLLEEAQAAGLSLTSVMSAEPVDGLDPAVSRYYVTPELLFVCRIPEAGPVEGDRLLLAEDLQDPGNVGTLIRTANAFGFDGVILAGACADPFGPKAVRASMGALFRRKVWTMPSGEAILALKEKSIPLVAAALRADAETLGKCVFPSRMALAIGNEGHGLSSEMLEAADRVVRIPMEPGAESLNAGAAAAVLLWEVYRRREE